MYSHFIASINCQLFLIKLISIEFIALSSIPLKWKINTGHTQNSENWKPQKKVFEKNSLISRVVPKSLEGPSMLAKPPVSASNQGVFRVKNSEKNRIMQKKKIWYSFSCTFASIKMFRLAWGSNPRRHNGTHVNLHF